MKRSKKGKTGKGKASSNMPLVTSATALSSIVSSTFKSMMTSKDPAFLESCQCDCLSVMAGLQSPFAWNSPPLMLDKCEFSKDKLFLVGTTFSEVFERAQLAYSLSCWNRRDEARAMLVHCYMYLLPDPDFGTTCSLVRDYGEALRHLLDATWAGLSVTARATPCHGVDPALRFFIGTIQPFDKMDRRQQAALHALHSRFCDEVDDSVRWLRKAINLSPDEGEWRFLLGWRLQEQRGEVIAPSPTPEEVTLLRDAHRLRPTPMTIVRLAKTLADAGTRGQEEAKQLIDEAQRTYPDNPAVLFQVVNVLPSLRERVPDADRLIERLLRKILAMTGESAQVRIKLAMLYMSTDQKKDSTREFDRALAANHEAAVFIVNLIGGKCQQAAEYRDSLGKR